jgi:hypothetical protein
MFSLYLDMHISGWHIAYFPFHCMQMFEELPVENIAVGTNIVSFKAPRTSEAARKSTSPRDQ